MVNTKTFAAKTAASVMLPALALGLFAAPALAAIETNVSVANVNTATIKNSVTSSASTGNNTAQGGYAGKGGFSGSSGSYAGNGGAGGDGGDGGDGDDGGDADVHGGKGNDDAVGGNGGDGGDAGDGSWGGDGGNTGNTGKGGQGGQGGDGGVVDTGNAYSVVTIGNNVNTNNTKVVVEDCGCDRYNVSSESSDKEKEWFSHESDKGFFGKDESTKKGSEESHWQKYTKTHVPVKTTVAAANKNAALVDNNVKSDADTGGNNTDGGPGAQAGNSGNSGGKAGNGGAGGDGGDGGEGDEGGDADVYGGWWKKNGGNDTAEGGEGGEGGTGGDGSGAGDGGNTGHTGDGGNGGKGGQGGVVVTGYAESNVAILNVVNRNITRIRR